MLTQEKANLISDYLYKDIDHTKELLDAEPEAVLAELKAAGIDCELEELVEYGNALNSAMAATQSGELNEEDLDQVAGGAAGIVITGKLILALAGSLGAGILVGAAVVGVAYLAVKKGW